MRPPGYPDQQPGTGPDPENAGESVNYLRRLKQNGAEGMPVESGARSGPGAAAAAPAPMTVERRKTPRIRCSGSVEFRRADSDVRMWGTLTDISLHGCYVEMNTTFPVDTKIDLVLKSSGLRIHARGTVRATYPFLGMGIRFEDLEPADLLHLKQFLTILAGLRNSGVVAKLAQEQDQEMKDMVAAAEPSAFIASIAEYFQKNQLLSKDEFHQIAKRVRRS